MTERKHNDFFLVNYLSGDSATLRAADELRSGAEQMRGVIAQYPAATTEQVGGRLAEVWHKSTFNSDALQKGLTERASTTSALGQPHAPADLVLSGGTPLPAAQLKFHQNPTSNSTHLARPAYHGMQKVVPSDQVDAVREHAARRARQLAESRPARSVEMQDTARNVSDRVQGGGAASKPLSTREAHDLVSAPGKLDSMALALEARSAAANGALYGAVFSGATSLVRNVMAAADGEQSAGDAVLGVVVDTAKGSATGVVGALATTATRAGMLRAGAGTLARGAAPAAIAVSTLEAAGSVVDLAAGRIDGAECGRRVAKAAGRGASGWAGAEVGAVIGTALLPGAGTVIGGVIGGLAATLGFSAMFD